MNTRPPFFVFRAMSGVLGSFSVLCLIACAGSPGMNPSGQEPGLTPGFVNDASTHRVVFSSPGTEAEAEAGGRLDAWQNIVQNPRYKMQQLMRNSGAGAGGARLGDLHLFFKPAADDDGGKWTAQIAANAVGNGVVQGAFPAKYTFNPIQAASCPNDFVVFPVNVAGSTAQANIVGFNNIYVGNCTGTVPAVLFAYNVGTGVVQTSPTLSVDGTKVAFIESITNGSKFHVLTLDKRGNAGCATSTSPCNGTAYSAPVKPSTSTSTNTTTTAFDAQVTLQGNVSITRSDPFVDYQNDIAYVGDDTGVLHKITPVFSGTPKEVTTGGWPKTVEAGTILTGPVFDSGTSQSIFVGSNTNISTGKLYCILTTGAFCTTASVAVGTGVIDPPLLDSSTEELFVMVNSTGTTSVSEVIQVNAAMTSIVTASVGAGGNTLHNGAFDNAYYNNPSAGHLYVCGNLSSASRPALWRVGFTGTTGVMNNAPDASSLQLVSNSGPTGYNCSPLTEAYNPTANSGAGQDLLFLSVPNWGNPSTCTLDPCLMSFDITGTTFPAVKSVFPLTPGVSNGATSGIVVDTLTTGSGGAQIYFGNLQAGQAEQVSQTGLN